MIQQFSKGLLKFSISADGKILGDWKPILVKSLLKDDKVKKIKMTIVPVILGGGEAMTLTGLPEGFLPHDRRFKLKEMKEEFGKIHLHYVRDRKKGV